MNFKTTTFLLLLLVIVGILYYLMESGPPLVATGDAPSPDHEGKPLFARNDFPTTSVVSIIIEKDGEKFQLTKNGADWRQTAPVSFPLTTWSVNQIGDDAARLGHVERFKPGHQGEPALKEIGLDPPKATITVSFEGDPTPGPHVFKLGLRLALGGRGYVMVNDDENVYVVNDDLHERILERKLAELRKKSFDGPKEGTSNRVQIARHSQAVDMIKLQGSWAFGPPHSGRVETEKVKELLDHVGSMYINEFIADEPPSLSVYGLNDPQTVVRVETAAVTGDDDPAETTTLDAEPDNKPSVQLLHIGAPVDFSNENFFATWSESGGEPGRIVFSVSKSFKEGFDKNLNDFRDPQITPIARNDIRELSVRHHDQTAFKLLYSGGAWSFGDPDPGYAADTSQVSSLVDAIADTKADAYDAMAAPTGDPNATITLSGIGRPEPDSLKVFDRDDDQYLVLRNNETTGYLVATDTLDRVFEPVLALRDRVVFELPRDQINRVQVQRHDAISYTFERDVLEPTQVSEEQGVAANATLVADAAKTTTEAEPTDTKPGPWRLEGHDEFESQALDDLLDALLTLRAERWHANEVPLEQVATVTAIAVDGTSTNLRVDTISRRAEASRTGPAPLTQQAFEMSGSFVDKLNAEFRHRTVLDFRNDDIVSITVTTDDGSTTIKKDDEKYVSESEDSIDQSAAGALFDTLAGLRAKRFRGQSNEQGTSIHFAIELQDGQRRQLVIDPQGNAGHLGGTDWFEMDNEAVSKLTANLIENAENL